MRSCCPYFNDTSSIFDNILPAVISGFIIILLFVVGRIIDSKFSLKTTRRSWYLQVIINPNLGKVDKFITDVLDNIKLSIELLIVSISVDSHQDYLEKKAQAIGGFQSLKRDFEYDFIQLIQTNYPKIANELSAFLREFEDDVTGILDNDTLDEQSKENTIKKIALYKSELYKILYTPLELGYKNGQKK